MMSFSKRLPCSCGGVIALLSWKQHIAFNLFFLSLAVIGIYLEQQITGNAPAIKTRKPPAWTFYRDNRLEAENPVKKM